MEHDYTVETANYPAEIEEKLGFDQVREWVKGRCLAAMGQEWVERMAFTTAAAELRLLLRQTHEYARVCLSDVEPPLLGYADLREPLARVRLEGQHLSVAELLDLRKTLEAFRGIERFFREEEPRQAYPLLWELASGMSFYPFVVDRIDQVVDAKGHVRDGASPELREIRRQMEAKERQLSKTLAGILRKAIEAGLVDPDTTPTVRDGKMLIPIAAAHKRRIPGLVHDESATGKTAFVEPLELVEANNAIRELYFAEKREVVRVLVLLTNDLRPYREDLLRSNETLGQLDFIAAKAWTALDMKAVMPRLEDRPMLDLRQARHPLLERKLAKTHQAIVPLDLELDGQDRILVISGPNAGGKSVCLKTTGLLQYMHQCGLLTPATEHSRMGIFRGILIDIGDQQSIENDLSTYSSHLRNMTHFCQVAGPDTLFLIDEFGTGTEPLLGGAIAQAVLESLHRQGAHGVVTTHYTNLKNYATQTPGILNGAMLFNNAEMRPIFKLLVGKPGRSFAFEIARRMGMPEELLEAASQNLGKDVLDYEKRTQELEEERWELRHQRRLFEQRNLQLEKEIQSYRQENEFLMGKKRLLLDAARREAKEIVEQANRQIENTIRRINESKADKETTRAARKELEDFKQEQEENARQEAERVEAKMRKLQEREARRKKQGAEPKKDERPPRPPKPAAPPRVGDLVRLQGQEATGELLALDGKEATVAFGLMTSKLKLDRLERVGPKPKVGKTLADTQLAQRIFEQNMQFRPEIDIRGLRGEEAVETTLRFIDQAVVAFAKEVRILHGTGNGILRDLVRQHLRAMPLVKSCRDEHVERGGSGITIAMLEY